MSSSGRYPPSRGQVEYLQLAAADLEQSARFYGAVFGWLTSEGGFEAPNLIGQWTTERGVAPSGQGPLLWIGVDSLHPTLDVVVAHGGRVPVGPHLDQGERWLVEVDDPAGNRLGLVAPVGTPSPQTLIAVRDVEASSRCYQQLLGLVSDHGGPEYERLLSGGSLALQLHQQDVEHHHGPIGDADSKRGNGVLLWFGEVSDFDEAVARAEQLGAPILKAVHRNPPAGEGNGPGHREIWLQDLDGYTVVIASPDGEAYESRSAPVDI